VALPPLDALVGIVAADAGRLLDGLNALCVHVAAVGCGCLPTRCRSAARSAVRVRCHAPLRRKRRKW
jgi:hypothetical protein